MVKFLIFIYFLLGSIFVTYPLILNLGGSLPSLGDELLITWILNWDIHSFLSNPLNIFNANIYYPYLNSLAFSDAFFTSALIAFIPVKIFSDPAIAYNFNLLFSFTTLGFFTYILTYYLTKNHYAAIVSGTLTAFSNFTILRTMHLQLISIQWISLSLLFFLKFAKTGHFKYLLLTSIFFILQTANSFLTGYFLIICFVVFLLIFYFKNKSFFYRFFAKKVLFLCLLTGVVLLPIIIPYFKVSKEFSYTRDIRDAIHFANRPEYTFYPNEKTRLKDFLLKTVYANDNGPYKYDGYLGGGLFVLIAVSIIYFLKKRGDLFFNIFFLIGSFSFILSLGPAFQWGGKVIKLPFIIPFPYALFYYLAPGFKGFRNSGRWEMLAVFAFSVAGGLFIAKILNNRSSLFKIILTTIICLSVFLELNFPATLASVPQKSGFPFVYSYVQTLPNNAVVIEMPIYNWDMLPYSRRELMREYFSTSNFKRMVNGGSGFSPPPWQEMVRKISSEFPSKNSISFLKALKVNYIVVHNKEFDSLAKNGFRTSNGLMPRAEIINKSLEENKNLSLINRLGDDWVYKVL